MDKYIVFRIEDRSYCVNLDMIDSVLRAVFITPIPEAPPTLLGLVNVRGRQTMIIDIHYLLGLSSYHIRATDLLILLSLKDFHRGLVANEVLNVIKIPDHKWTSPENIHPDLKDYFTAVTNWNGENLILLDIDRLFSSCTLFEHCENFSLEGIHLGTALIDKTAEVIDG